MSDPTTTTTTTTYLGDQTMFYVYRTTLTGDVLVAATRDAREASIIASYESQLTGQLVTITRSA